MKNRILLLGLAILLTFTISARDGQGTAPDFTVNLLDGGSFKLSDNSGKVVLIFFFGYNCPPCIAASPSVQQNLVDVFKSNSEFTAIAIDAWNGSTAQVNSFKNQSGISFAIGKDGGTAAGGFSSSNDRLVVVDKDGNTVHNSSKNAASDITAVKAAIEKALDASSGGGNGGGGEGGGGTSSTNDVSLSDAISYFPNPSSDRLNLNLNFETPGDIEIGLIDATGRQIYSQSDYFIPGANNIKELNVSEYPAGMYFLRIDFQNERIIKKVSVLN